MIAAPIALIAFAAVAAIALYPRPDRRRFAAARAAAAVGLVWVALASGALESTSGRLVLAALISSGVGDVALAGREQRATLAGIGALALAHSLYAIAFVLQEVNGELIFWAFCAVLVMSSGVTGWLLAYVRGRMRWTVLGYVLAISLMLVCAWGGLPFSYAALGATALYVSDLAVARDRFVSAGRVNVLWGLPVYYLGQVLLARYAH